MKSPIILADSGPLVALHNRKDTHHSWALNRFREFTESLLTTECVLTEALHLLRKVPLGTARLLGQWQHGLLHASFSAEAEKTSLLFLMRRYSELPISLADASLIRLSEIHSACKIWTLDADFLVYRRHGRQAIPLITPGR